jgi:phenylalanyl-tRNA synthetase beta chain
MVIVETKLSKLKKLVDKNLTVKQLETLLADMGMQLDEVDSDNLKVELTAERTDLLTVEGLARAIKCYKEAKPYKEIPIKKSKFIHKVNPNVKKYRPHTRSFVVKKVKFTDESIKDLMNLQEKIHDTYGRKRKKVAIGVYDFNQINFPLTYLMMKPEAIKFAPLGMTKELNGKQILRQHPTGKDYAKLIEKDDKYPIQIDAKKQILSMPPIINSDNLGQINENTKNIFVECTGNDERALANIMNILATMFYDQGGEIHECTIKYNDHSEKCPTNKTEKRTLSTQFVNSLIGLDLKPKEIAKLLPKMMYKVNKVIGDKIYLEVPSTRVDIWHDVDVADDVARAYGYNNITPKIPSISTIGESLDQTKLQLDLSDYLSQLGLTETITFALTSEKDQYESMNVDPSKHINLGKDTAEKSINMVRSWLLPETLKSFTHNRSNPYPQKIFELGDVVIPNTKEQSKAKNEQRLVCAICDKNADFTSIKQILDSLLSYLGIDYILKENKHNSFIPGRVGKIQHKSKEIGIIGEISPQVLTSLNIEYPVVCFEIELNKLKL